MADASPNDDDSKRCAILDIPEQIFHVICVHLEYAEILQSLLITSNSMNQMVQNLLSSPHYVYRLHITNMESVDDRPLTISQIKYFKEYKSLLDESGQTMDVRIPTTYIRLTFNFYHVRYPMKRELLNALHDPKGDADEKESESSCDPQPVYPLKDYRCDFRKWLFKYWNSGLIQQIITNSVHILDRFLTEMHPPNCTEMLSLQNTVQFLKLTAKIAPQPMHDANRLVHVLSLLDRYRSTKVTEPMESNLNENVTRNLTRNFTRKLYALSIGFHIKDDVDPKYIESQFIPKMQFLRNLKILTLHGCHRRGGGKEVDLLDGVMDAVNDNLVYLEVSFAVARAKGKVNRHGIRFPESVQCIHFGYDFETFDAHKVTVDNVEALKSLKMVFIEMNPKRLQIEVIGQLIQKCESLQCVAINLGIQSVDWGLYEERMSEMVKYWKRTENGVGAVEVVVITSVPVITPKYRSLLDRTFGDKKLMKMTYCFERSGIEWLFEFVAGHIACDDAIFQRLWRLQHFGRHNFSSLRIERQLGNGQDVNESVGNE